MKIEGILTRVTHPDWSEKEARCLREKAMYHHLEAHSCKLWVCNTLGAGQVSSTNSLDWKKETFVSGAVFA